MSLKIRLIDGLGKLLGASWSNPLKTAARSDSGAVYHSPTSFTATASSKDSVTLSSVNPTVSDASEFRCVRAYGTAGELVGEWFPSATHRFIWSALTNKLTVSGADWSSAKTIDVELRAEERAYNSASDSYQQTIVNPAWDHWTPDTLADVTNGADNTYYYYLDMSSYRYAGFQIALGCVAGTVDATLEATFQDDGTAQGSCTYIDCTNDLFGVASLQAAAGTASDLWVIDTPYPAKYLRVKIVANTAGNTGDWTIYVRTCY